MSLMDWLRGTRPGTDDGTGPRGDGASHGDANERVDPETGEITQAGSVRRVSRHAGAAAGESEGDTRTTGRQEGVAGERTIPSVNRELSMQSRVSNALAIGTIVLLGAGFLFWYYSTRFSKDFEARLAAQKMLDARAAGEMKLSPLGRLDPPMPPAAAGGLIPVASHDLLGPAPRRPKRSAWAPARRPGRPRKRPRSWRWSAGWASRCYNMARRAVPWWRQLCRCRRHPKCRISPRCLAPRAAARRALGDSGGASLASMLQPTPTPAVEAQVLPTRRFLLPKGAFIDCTLETAIDSTFDGMVTCVGANDVYSADGKVVLLERGTKYFGEKRGETRLGQGRIFVLWSEARTPTGVVARLDSPGTDELGRTGLPGHVDTHFWDRFGAAILISVIDGGLQALAASQGAGGGTTVQLSPTGSRDVMTEILRSTIAIPPTILKNQGDRIQVLVARDVDFRSVYALRTPAQY